MERPYADHNRAFSRVRAWGWALAGLCSLSALTLEVGKGPVTAAEWSAAPSLSVKGVYNSNLLLNNGNNEVIGYWVTPAVKFKGATEALDVEGETRADFVHYYGDVDRELTNLYFPLRASYRSDRHTLGFEGGFTRDNTLRGELEETGLVLSFTQRSMWTAMPTWTVGITERLSWQSGYQFADTSYQDGLRLGLVDYQVNGGTTGLTYNVGELDQLRVTSEYTLVRMPFIGLTTTYYGAQGGWTHDFGHELIGSVSGGGRLVSADQDIQGGGSVTSHEIVWVYNASLSKRFERTTIRVEGGRQINPSGFGRLLQTDRVGGVLVHNLTETLTASLAGNLNFVSGLATNPASRALVETRFFSVSPSLSWKFAQWWTLGVAYTYAERAVDDLDQHNDAHSTFITLTYGGEKWSVSR
ncbi:MAG: hypothetical protein KF693_09950 [Nitrospira sp.]|nr:hypothetical protein [Nitrospira sp.]